jgi:RHS repeat-associated protein
VGRRELAADGSEVSFRGWIYRDLLRPIAEVDASGNVVARYVYGDGSGSKQNGVAQLATRLGANQDTSLPFSGSNVPEFIERLDGAGAVVQRLHLITNQVGTVEAVVDAATGEVVQRIELDEFGRVLSDSAPGLQPFGFAGGLYDSATGLVRFGARDYSPEVGRWIARDPVRFGGKQLNAFAYANGRPIDTLDASGLVPWDRLYGLPKRFWKWYHSPSGHGKPRGTPDLEEDEARELCDGWKKAGEPSPDNRRGGTRNKQAPADDDPWGDLMDMVLPFELFVDPCDVVGDQMPELCGGGA